MKNMNNITAVFGAIILLVSNVHAAEPQKGATPKATAAKSPLDDEVVAKGKGLEIKRTQLDEAFLAVKASAAAAGQTIPENQRAEVESRLLDRLVFTQLLLKMATDEDKTKGKEAAGKVLGQYRSQERSEEAFLQKIKAMGMKPDQFQQQVIEQATVEQVLDRELKHKIIINDEETKKYYEENAAQFEKPEQVRAAHVLISTKDATTNQDLNEAQKKDKKKLAEKVLGRAKAGEDFAKLAKEYSDDPGSKDAGGEYTFGRGRMVAEFEAAAFSLTTNQVSDIVTTQYGYHIIKLNEKIPAQKVEYAKVEKDIKEHLTMKEIEKRLPDYLSKLKEEAGVEILGVKDTKETAPAKKK